MCILYRLISSTYDICSRSSNALPWETSKVKKRLLYEKSKFSIGANGDVFYPGLIWELINVPNGRSVSWARVASCRD